MSKSNGKTKKKKVGKVFLWILGVLIAVILLTVAVFSILNAVSVKANMELASSFEKIDNPDAIVPEKADNGNWVFKTDRDLKILQLTDVHIGGGCLSSKNDAMAINAVASMVSAEKPDLVVITGDIAFPVPFISGTINNLRAAKIFATLMEQLGVPWVPVFGNHDTEVYSFYSREEVSEFYGGDTLKHCLFQKGNDDVDGCGNSVIEVQNQDGIVTQALFLLDSHAYTDDDALGILWKYDHIHDNQIEWYKNGVLSINERNANTINTLYANDEQVKENMEKEFGNVSSLLFFHIPLHEYQDAWNEYVANGYNDTDKVQLHYGTVGEIGSSICIALEDDKLFETMETLGGEKGIFCGHDHLNNFSLDYNGIRLTYGHSIDYLAYSGISEIGSQRGCTIIDAKTDGSFDCVGSNYYQDKYEMLSENEKETVLMQDMDEWAKQEK